MAFTGGVIQASVMATDSIRTAFITGASSGIGAALARLLATQGITVALAARREGVLRELAQEIEGDGGAASIYPVDVSDPEATEAIVRKADDDLGGLDLVVANAGVAKGQWGGKLRWSHCANLLAVNVAGATATLTAVLPRMVERKRGHLVGVSSIAGLRGMPKMAAYSASKAYLRVFMESLRVDLSGTGVKVTEIRPGYVRTPMTADNATMPFAVSAKDAAARTWKAIRNGRSVLTFPLPMAGGAGLVSALPNALYDVAMRPRR